MNRSIRRIAQMLFGFLALAFLVSVPARADDASAKLYAGKCAGCHGADGAGTTVVGKALKVKDFHDPDVQKQSDADLNAIISKGKDKMPEYDKTLKPEEIKGLVAYVRELGKK
jgi:mono/diheme cytochrome c family protein